MIETERLILRRFSAEDAEDLYEYLHEPEVHCFYCMRIDSLADAKVAAQKRSEDQDYYAIELKESGKVIGEVFAHAESSDPEAHAKRDTYSPCWMLHKDYYRNGYMFEAGKAFFDDLFFEKDARRIYIYTEDYNISCQKLCEKLGMRREGLFKEFVSFVNDKEGNPVFENTYQYAILKKEWQDMK